MKKKPFLIAFLATHVLLLFLFLVINIHMNQDQEGFKSTIPVIDAAQIKQEPNAVVAVVSHGCPGHPTFMPKLEKLIEPIKTKGYKLFIVDDTEYTAKDEKQLVELAKAYNIAEPIYFINPDTYPKNGGFFNTKRRYRDFVTELSPALEDEALGYSFYMVFKNGNLVYNGFFLKEEEL